MNRVWNTYKYHPKYLVPHARPRPVEVTRSISVNFWVFDGVIDVLGRSREEHTKYPKNTFWTAKIWEYRKPGYFERKGNFEHRSFCSYNSVCCQNGRTYYRVRHKFLYTFVGTHKYLFWMIRMVSCGSKVIPNYKHHNQSYALKTSITVLLSDKHIKSQCLQTSSLVALRKRRWSASYALGWYSLTNFLSSKVCYRSWGLANQGFHRSAENYPGRRSATLAMQYTEVWEGTLRSHQRWLQVHRETICLQVTLLRHGRTRSKGYPGVLVTAPSVSCHTCNH